MAYSGTIAATCAPVNCIDCPDIAPAIAAQEICSGTDPDFATVETEVNATGNNIGTFSYFMDAGYTIPYNGPPTNTTCNPLMITIYGRLQCSDPNAAGTAEEFDDFSFMVTVYPGQYVGFVLSNAGMACSEAEEVLVVALLASDVNTVCAINRYDASANTTCATVSEDITYTWTVAELEMISTVPAGLSCYTDVTGSESVTVYPAQPTANVINVVDACTADATVVTFQVTDAVGNVCDERTYDAAANMTCAVAVQNFTDTYSAADLETLFGSPAISCYTDLAINENVNVYPDANNFGLEEVSGSCGTPSSVSITAENGDICYSETGNTPMDPGCDNPDDVQDLTYSYDPGFIPACNATFGNTLPASCATTSFSPAPSFTCPTGSIDFCALMGPIDLMPMDANNVGATGVFGGSAAGFVVGNQDPGMGATLDLSNAPPGNYTLEYTLTSPGCPPLTTAPPCTFELVINCNANGGRF